MNRLYKKDTKGKTRILEILTEGAELVQRSGLKDGALVEHRKTCKGKNIGKSNETTPENQAISEMNSKIAEKLTEGYFRTEEEMEEGDVILPMLAKSYGDELDKINWLKDVYVQPKLDGMRCLAFKRGGKVILQSRDGKIIQNMGHIETALAYLAEDVIMDGELYCHGRNFQENMRLIKKYRPGETEEINYHIYDIVSPLPFKDRHAILEGTLTSPLVDVPTSPIAGETTLKYYHQKFLSEGYEGTIIRHGDEGYKKNGRSSSLLKYKDFKDIALPIIDVVASEQRPTWGQPIFEFYGKQFSAGMKYSHAEREEFLKNKKDYIGKTAEIRFFEYSEEGIPRFPVMVGIRLDK